MSAFVLQFAYCIATVPCCIGTVLGDKRAEVGAQVERSKVTQVKQETARSGTFIWSQHLFKAYKYNLVSVSYRYRKPIVKQGSFKICILLEVTLKIQVFPCFA